jgi:beta-1,4-mannosyl-glycoprotein beta-1,4-N-acetylglucosaminyltransferase
MISKSPFYLYNSLYTDLTLSKQLTPKVVLAVLTMYCCLLVPFMLVMRVYNRKPTSEFVESNRFLPLHEALELCDSYNLDAYPNRTHRRKIYDLFLMNTELDWLEIRLNELYHHIDYFVILEATNTFRGNPKSLHFKSNFDNFKQFSPKIIYHVLNIEDREDDSSWEREAYTRNSLLDAIFPSLLGAAAPEFGDVILVSDIDEIPRPDTLRILRNCQFPERTSLWSRFYYYSFQWLHIGEEWHSPQATYYQGKDTIKPHDLRASSKTWNLRNASWHCSSCFSTIAELSTKIESFSHREFDQPQFKEAAEIVRRVRNGLDLFDRKNQKYEKIESNNDIPEYIKLNKDRFNYILDRDPPNANFRDYVGGE